MRSPKRGCSPSITARRAGPGTSSASTPRATPTMSSTSWSASSAACRSRRSRRCSSWPASATSPRSPCFRSFCGSPEEQVARRRFGQRVRQELVERLEGSYKFVHDRVQEAAYSLIPEALRAEVHLRIGRLLAAQTPPEEREEAIFEIVNQLNRGAALITSHDEREQLAELNLIAGQRAKASTAYAAALTYLDARCDAAGGRWLGAPARADLCAGAGPGRMRIPDRRAGGRRGAIGGAFEPRHDNGRASRRRLPAHGCLHDPRSERSRGRRLPRLPPAVSASNGRPIRQRRTCVANTTASGRGWEAGRSRT